MLAVVGLGCGVAGRPEPPLVAPDPDAGLSLETIDATVDEKPGDVKLRFAWPAALAGRCATIARRIEPTGNQVVRTAYSLRAQRDGEQVRIESFDAALPADVPAAMRPLAETWHAEWVTDGQGRLLRATPLDAGLEAPERAAVTARMVQRWQTLVGAWTGRTLPLAATYTVTAPEQTAEGPVRLQISVRADGRVPCEPGDTASRCVRLRILSQPTGNDRDAVARVAARELLPADEFLLYESSRVRAFGAMTDVMLVTEPDTLVPHRFTERRVLRMRVDPLIGTGGIDVNRQDVVTTACTWGGR
jgi:hypothetical protein